MFLQPKYFLQKLLLALFFICFVFAGCKNKSSPVVLWTNRSEFVSYAELFNSQQEDAKVLVVYKEDLSTSLPPAKDETTPDIIIGDWLKNSVTRKNFMSLDHLFAQLQLNREDFYPQLLEAGTIDGQLCLLPISFNLPAVILSSKNRNLLDDEYIISMAQMKEKGASYNKQNKSGLYTSMGFGPSWNQDFLYLALKLKGVNFTEKGNSFIWDNNALNETAKYLKEWTKSTNTSTSSEDDFKFKYLYTPSYTLVSSERCLFATIRSDEFFNVSEEKLQNIDYRWLHEQMSIPMEDDIVSLGIYKKSKNTNLAESFIVWFMQEESQKAMLERSVAMKLNTRTFGISGGFSSIRKVNERIFPLFYPMLLRNIPPADHLVAPNVLPPRWESIKDKVILPYIKDAVDTSKEKADKSMKELLAEWNKQYF